jgi:hypothetical protein
MKFGPRPTPGRRPPFATLILLGATAVVAAIAAPACGSSTDASDPTASSGTGQASPLVVVEAPTPPLRVPRYDTEGTFPQVRDGGIDLAAVNRALRLAVLSDQREYAPDARRYSRGTARRYRGVYRTTVDRRLLSASTVVVSALMPATKLYPGGNQGRTWVAATVRVPSGQPVRIIDLFAKPERGLRVLAREWKARLRRTRPELWPCVTLTPADYRPTARNYRLFALTVGGLAVGFWQAPACDRLHATVPYAALRPHLSELGKTLVAGVRRPRRG